MKVNIQIDSYELKRIFLKHLQGRLDCPLTEEDVKVQVKKYKRDAEWEEADFRIIIDKYTFGPESL